jgi:hypothetical protein
MTNFLGNFISLIGVPVFYFQNVVTLGLIKRFWLKRWGQGFIEGPYWNQERTMDPY